MIGKVMKATLREILANKGIIIAMILASIFWTQTCSVNIVRRQIDYSVTLTDFMVTPFCILGMVLVCMCAANMTKKLVANNFFDIERACGMGICKYINIKLIAFEAVSIVLMIFHTVVQIFTWKNTMKEINTFSSPVYDIKIPTDELLWRTGLVLLLVVIPMTLLISLTAMLITMLLKMAIPSIALVLVYVIMLIQNSTSGHAALQKWAFPFFYLRGNIITIKDKLAAFRNGGLIRAYTLEGGVTAMVIIIVVCIIEYLLVVRLIKRRKCV